MPEPNQLTFKIGDLRPDCGAAALVWEASQVLHVWVIDQASSSAQYMEVRDDSTISTSLR
jgi:hypothetical protein